MNKRLLPAFVVLAGLAISACACGSPASSGSASSGTTGNPASHKPQAAAAQAAPAGYQIVGGPPQGISLAVPDSWKAVEFPQDTVSQAPVRLGLPASSQQIYQTDVMAPAARVHALYALDTPHLMRIYDKKIFGGQWAGKVFGASVNAFCSDTPGTTQGTAGLARIRSEEIDAIRSEPATVDGTRDVTLAGIPSLEVLYNTFPPGPPLPELHAAQIVTLLKAGRAGRACYTTVTFPGALSSSVLNEVIASARFYR